MNEKSRVLFTLHIINKSIETETCENIFICDDSETDATAHPVTPEKKSTCFQCDEREKAEKKKTREVSFTVMK